MSICPPHAALDVARAVSGFEGTYVDANAISPATARKVAAVIERGGASYVDGGIIGAPADDARYHPALLVRAARRERARPVRRQPAGCTGDDRGR